MFMKYLYKSSKIYIWTLLYSNLLHMMSKLLNHFTYKISWPHWYPPQYCSIQNISFFFMIKIYFPTSWYELKKIKKRERKLNLKGKKRDKEKVCILMSYFHYTKIDDVYICFFFFFFENPCIYFLWYIVSYIFF